MIPQDTNLAKMIDHTLLKPDATPDQIAQLCFEARKYQFASVCVNPAWVKLCAQLLEGSPVKVCTVIGFPLGATASEVKAFEANNAIDQGATEIDMVINIGALKARELEFVAQDIRGVVQRCPFPRHASSKSFWKLSLLNDEEKTVACLLSKEAGADFVKTSTGFAGGGATVHDVALMRRVVGPEIGVKASGGVRTYEDAESMIKAGATRIGASAGIKIMQGPSAKVNQLPQALPVLPALRVIDLRSGTMLIARVIGTTVSTIKDPKLSGQKLLILRQTDEHGEAFGKPYVAIDTVDAGVGDLVLTCAGSSARQTATTKDTPVDAVIMSIIDSLQVNGEVVFKKSR